MHSLTDELLSSLHDEKQQNVDAPLASSPILVIKTRWNHFVFSFGNQIFEERLLGGLMVLDAISPLGNNTEYD